MTPVSAAPLPRAATQVPAEPVWTEVKTKQAWLNTFASLSFIGSCAAAGVGFTAAAPLAPLAAVGIPLLLASGALLFYSRSLIDYDDPAVLDTLRREARSLPLPAVVEKHTWEKLFRYTLLTPDEFAAAYRAHANTLSFKSVVAFYREAQAQAPYPLPAPTEWKSRFEAETVDFGCDTLLANYSLADLVTYQIITPAQAQALQNAAEAHEAHLSRLRELDEQFLARTPQERHHLQTAIDLAHLAFRSHPVHNDLAHLHAEEETEIDRMRRSIRCRIACEEEQYDQFRTQLLDSTCGCLSDCDQMHLNNRRAQRDAALNRLHLEESSLRSQIRREGHLRRFPLESTLAVIEQMRNRQIAAAQEQFNLSTAPVRQEIDLAKAKSRFEYEEALTACNKAYRA